MRRLFVALGLAAAATVALIVVPRGADPASPRAPTLGTPPPGWELVDFGAEPVRSFAVAGASQAAVVGGSVRLRRGAGDPWSRFVGRFRAASVAASGAELFVFGVEEAASAGAPLVLRLLPRPSDVVPLPCLPAAFAVRGAAALLACAGGQRLLRSKDGLKSFTDAALSPIAANSIDAVALGPGGEPWAAFTSRDGSGGLIQLGACDGGAPDDHGLGPIRVRALRAGEGELVAAGFARVRGGGDPLAPVVLVVPANDLPHFSRGPPCAAAAEAATDLAAAFAGPDEAWFACSGRLFATEDRGRSFHEETAFAGAGVRALWAGDGWVAVLAGDRLFSRTGAAAGAAAANGSRVR